MHLIDYSYRSTCASLAAAQTVAHQAAILRRAENDAQDAIAWDKIASRIADLRIELDRFEKQHEAPFVAQESQQPEPEESPTVDATSQPAESPAPVPLETAKEMEARRWNEVELKITEAVATKRDWRGVYSSVFKDRKMPNFTITCGIIARTKNLKSLLNSYDPKNDALVTSEAIQLVRTYREHSFFWDEATNIADQVYDRLGGSAVLYGHFYTQSEDPSSFRACQEACCQTLTRNFVETLTDIFKDKGPHSWSPLINAMYKAKASNRTVVLRLDTNVFEEANWRTDAQRHILHAELRANMRAYTEYARLKKLAADQIVSKQTNFADYLIDPVFPACNIRLGGPRHIRSKVPVTKLPGKASEDALKRLFDAAPNTD